MGGDTAPTKLMNKPPIYTSNCTRKSLWQRYEIFDDRLELHTWLGNLRIPLDNIEQAEVLPPSFKSLRLHVKKCLFGLKLDLPDWNEHIVLEKKSGLIRHVLFTTEDPAEFKRVLDEAITRFRESPNASKARNRHATSRGRSGDPQSRFPARCGAAI